MLEEDNGYDIINLTKNMYKPYNAQCVSMQCNVPLPSRHNLFDPFKLLFFRFNMFIERYDSLNSEYSSFIKLNICS